VRSPILALVGMRAKKSQCEQDMATSDSTLMLYKVGLCGRSCEWHQNQNCSVRMLLQDWENERHSRWPGGKVAQCFYLLLALSYRWKARTPSTPTSLIVHRSCIYRHTLGHPRVNTSTMFRGPYARLVRISRCLFCSRGKKFEFSPNGTSTIDPSEASEKSDTNQID
jgi:hypothetical protein